MECPSGAPIEELRVFGLGAGLFGLGLTLIASVLVFAAVSCAVRSCRPGGFCAVLLANLALALFLVLLPKACVSSQVGTLETGFQSLVFLISGYLQDVGQLAGVEANQTPGGTLSILRLIAVQAASASASAKTDAEESACKEEASCKIVLLDTEHKEDLEDKKAAERKEDQQDTDVASRNTAPL
ncbi:hypothetical protein AK812_SmicGene36387 [Symbiodinium microadriaticum]|uniref:Uncharacterized protein n=1 Tax=Symbiodinium microadriaticum TaxID=2951 RepID=A0A1Q9CJ32_SYMMI|nr:hypothetical protein AK812_SmicGene36387 [Symbiodinium microadriaticum]